MSDERTFVIGNVTFDPASGELRGPAAVSRLEPKAAAVLAILCAKRDQVVARQQLLDRCWGTGEGSDEALTQAVAQIRRALQEVGETANLLQTLAKRGYRLSAEGNARHGGPVARPTDRKARLSVLLGAALVLALVAALTAFPHQLRHSFRHALGLGPPAGSGATH